MVIAATAAPGLAAAASEKDPEQARIGYVGTNRNSPLGDAVYRAFADEMVRGGFEEGRNLTIDFRAIEQSPEALLADAGALVRSGVNLIVTDGTEAALRAASTATRTLPIVMVATNFDPIEHGYVDTLGRPGHNITGVFLRQTELADKQTELLRQAVPEATRMAVLWDAVSVDQFNAAQRSGKAIGLTVTSVKLERPPYDFAAAFRSLVPAAPQLLLVLSSPNFTASRQEIAALAIRNRLPTMFIFKTYAQAGGMLSYGVDYEAMHRQVAVYVAKILKGAHPSELPIEQPTKFEMVVNLKTAHALGLKIPQALLLRADEVIE